MKEPMKKIKSFAAMLATGLSLGVGAEVVPFGIFNSGMVLPRSRPVAVWGKADVGEAVTVAFAGQSVATNADAKGDWSVQLAEMSANATGRTMTITGKNVITLENVLVGDVWLCAGQSNMAMRYNPDNEVIRPYLSEADGYSMIRSINGQKNVENFSSESPWVVAASNTMGKITLTGYFFARRLVNELEVPIGLVDTSIPGMGIEAFLGPAVSAYNRSIAPFGFKGAIWYQGESNCGDNEAYRFKMTQLVGEWREALAMPELPFFYVQLCAYGDSSFTQLREAQRMAMTMIPEPVGMACTIDIGDFGGLHPFNKYDVGERLAAWALNKTYGKTEVVVSGPLYKSIRTEGNRARLSFDFADGLKLGKKGGIEFIEDPAPTMADVVKKFKLAGADGVWHDADSVAFDGGDVLVSSASVASPTAVRYAYEKNPTGAFIYNSANLPMVPFRTDYDPDYFGEPPDWTPKTEVLVTLLSPLGCTGGLQTGVVAKAGYKLSGDFAATAVGVYTATVTLNEGYQWSDHLKEKSRPVTWSIVEDLTSVGVQLWEDGPEWAMCNIPTNTLEVYGEVFRFDDASNAVSKALGDPWRVPTDTELQELVDKCNTQWMTNGNNVVGCLFTSKSNGKSIFLPAAGCLHGNGRDDIGKRGCYWSSVVVPGTPDYGFYLSVASDSIHRNWTQRSLAGASVRPVRDAGSGDGPRKAVAPTGKTLTYTGKEQVGVEAKTGSTLSGVVKATDANDEYKATATLVDGYEWADGVKDVSREIKWSIAKATPVISGTLAMAGWKEGKTASEPSGLTADFGAVTYAYYADQTCTQAIDKPTTEGTYYVRGEVAASANWNAAVSTAKQFKITETGGGGGEPVVPPSGDGPTVKIDSVMPNNPSSTILVNWTLENVDPQADYEVVLSITADGQTKGVTNAMSKLADGKFQQFIDTAALFGEAKSCPDAKVGVSLVLVTKSDPQPKGGVQLWENGPYWAEWNAGATKPEEFGEVGRFDNASDLVSRTFGAPWRVPTMEELQELDDRCSYSSEVTAINGVDGRVFTSEYTDKSIFFPFAGCLHGDGRDDIGIRACSWSSTIYEYEGIVNTNYVFYLSIGRGAADSDTGVHINHTGRIAAGATVRPVRDNIEYDRTLVAFAEKAESIIVEEPEDAVNYTSVDGLAEALATNANLIAASQATDALAEGGDYILKLSNEGGTEYVHVFLTTKGTATFTPKQDLTAQVLVIGGGGGGGNVGDMSKSLKGGGGGGAGAVAEESSCELLATAYDVVVGAGGLGGGYFYNRGNGMGCGQNGGVSSLSCGGVTVVSASGGGGGGSNLSFGNGCDGGCGGGACGHSDTEVQFSGGKGNDGHDGGFALKGLTCAGSGGGGVGAEGGSSFGAKSGNGGNGIVKEILGYRVYFAGGGAGGSNEKKYGNGGLGGGGSGNSLSNDGSSGANGLGGGGAGASNGVNALGGNGGSGAVIIRYTVGGSGPRKAVVPTGKTLTYTGKEQVGVEAKTGSTLSGVVKATDANDEYKATATLIDGYEWADGVKDVSREIKWSIAKATPVISGTLAMVGWKEGETASEPSGLSADFGAVTYAYYADQTCTQAIAKPTTEGTYYVRGEVAASANWNAAVSAAKQFKIAKAGGGGDEPGDDPEPVAKPTVTVEGVETGEPWSTITVEYTLDGLDAETKYALAFEVTADGLTRGVTNAQAILTAGVATQEVDTVALFGSARSDANAKVRVALLAEGAASGGVQLWDGGPYWAECNLGANSPVGLGDMKAFGDAADAVKESLGDYWRLPKKSEAQGLVDSCNSEWTSVNDVNGLLVTSKFNGNSIFLPVTGIVGSDPVGYYWTADALDVSGYAWDYSFGSSGKISIYYAGCATPLGVRAVTDGLGGEGVVASGEKSLELVPSGDEPALQAELPTGKSDLVYTGKEQIGVEDLSGSTLTGDFAATTVGVYVATATLDVGYEWADGVKDVSREIKWSIAKATPTISGTLAMAGWKEGETASEPSGLTADFGAVTYAYYADQACTQAIAKPTTADTYYVRGEVAASANWNAAVSTAKAFTISKAGGEDAINFTTVDGFEEALKTNEHLVSEAPAQGGDYILKLDNGDGSADYVHVFMTTGEVKTFTTTDDLVARMLLVGGGGGGGGAGNYFVNTYKAIGGGGGGAGAMVERSGYDLAAGTYNIVVGKGGCGAAYFNAGENGGQSSIARDDMEPIVAIGGGGGGSWNTSVQNAHDGACGGGACGTGNTIAGCTRGTGDPGKDGGSVTEGQDCSGAGGGGMTTVGKDSTGLESGGGGDGDSNDIMGCPIYFAGGGAGGVSGTSTQYGSGGLGGGASATSGNGAPGVNGLGGGGSGGSNLGTASGGNGGSGVVIIRYTVGGSVDPEPGRTVTVTRGEGIADISTASGSVFADDAKSATVELAAGAETLELTLVAAGDLVIPAYKLVTNSVTNVTVRTATYAVAGGESLTFLATETGEDETLGADETLSAIMDAIDDSDGETHAAAVAKVKAIASAGEGGKRMVEPRELAAWIADNRIASAELAASDYAVASVKLDTDKPITEEAAVAFSGIAANADTGIVLEFTLVLEGETDDALALAEGDARKEFVASCIQVTDDLAAGFDGTTIAPELVEILDGGKVRIGPEAASAAGFCRIVIPKDPPQK